MKKHVSILFTIFCLSFLSACSSSSTSGGNGTTSETLFVDAAKNTAPAFTAVASAAAAGLRWRPTGTHAVTAFGSGSALYAAFNLMRDYEFPRDEGKIDMTNIYKALHEASSAYAMAVTTCTPITEAAVVSPFSFGLSDTYDCAGNQTTQEPNYGQGFAIREAAGVKYALVGFKWAPTPNEQISLGTLQGQLDTGTNEVLMHMVNLVTYPAGSPMGGETGNGFSVRSFISGNSTDHTFELKSLVTGIGTTPNWTSIVGKGISRGTGNFFLFKVWMGNGDMLAIDGKYFCIDATADETALSAMDQDGLATVDANCAAYQERVDVLATEKFVRTDAPLLASDFTNSTIHVTY